MKTSELSGAALDWAVAKCEKETFVHGQYEHSSADNTIWARGGASVEKRFSVDWAYGGPIIEREQISVWLAMDDIFKKDTWAASYSYMDGDLVCEPEQEYWGHTPLIAAMRCYVASKLGEEVKIPEELKGE